MAHTHARRVAIAVFGIGTWVALVISLVTLGGPTYPSVLEFALETYLFAAVAATVGFAVAGCRSAVQALCAVPVAIVLTLLVPPDLGVLLSQSFHSVVLNVTVMGLVFAVAGAAACASIC